MNCELIRKFSQFGLMHRKGHVESWDELLHNEWVHQRALVDWDCGGDITSGIDTMISPPHSERPRGMIVGNQLLLWKPYYND